MSVPDEGLPGARSRPRRWFSWIWIAPLLAVGIVVWLAIRALVDRGPMITISFSDAEGIQAGDTKLRHKDVDLGTVESVYLSHDMSRVFVRARVRRSVTPHLTTNTRFWIVRPRVGIGGISGLQTLVSGSYIEMYPGDGSPQRSFVGLDDPPALTPNTPGRAFTLRTDDLGSLNAGSPISYRGVPVGEIEGFQLDPSGKQIDLYAFVRSPYEKYVTAQTRFWNSGGIDVAVGAQGLRFRASSVQQLISGGVSFDTPDAALHDTESVAGTPYRLYSNQYDAQRDPRGNKLVYRVEFEGGASEVGPGTSVQLQGAEVGEVTEARLQFDDARQSLITRVTLELDPSRIEIVHERRKQSGGATPSAGRAAVATAAVATAPLGTAGADVTVASAAALDERLRKLVARGLRARLVAANLLTGGKVVSLDLVHDAPPARIEQVEGFAEIPSTSATDITSVLATVQSVLRHLDTVTGGPELGHAVKELDRTLTNLDRVSAELEPQIKPLMAALRETADATQHTLQAANNVLGTSAASGADVPRLLRELTEAARSLRELTDYLSRHPESLIRGRKAEPP